MIDRKKIVQRGREGMAIKGQDEGIAGSEARNISQTRQLLLLLV